jgi:hypothetical protein
MESTVLRATMLTKYRGGIATNLFTIAQYSRLLAVF